jgi:hypothetical protein
MAESSEHNKFREKYGVDFFTAVCIQTGYMLYCYPAGKNSTEKFCKAGKGYQYILVEDDPEDPIIMKSECDREFIHAMSWRFFYEYFIKSEKEDFIKRAEMTI